ncbi:12048_t:CDS:2, partial [Ambispora leptoticha]
AYPRLKDANINLDKYPELYYQLVKIMRIMYQTCHLVHADLSEYNILYHSRKLYIIDVSQSIEHDHPHSLEFLRKDCANVTDYFKKKGVRTMSVRELFDFITDLDIGVEEDAMNAELDKIKERLSNENYLQNEDQDYSVEEAVFKQAYIPRTLDEVIDAERDVQKLMEGEGDEENQDDERDEEQEDGSSESEEQDEDDSKEEEDKTGDKDIFAKTPRGKRNEDKEAKKERKKIAKDETREKRKNKIPKAVKKRKVKTTSGKKKAK